MQLSVPPVQIAAWWASPFFLCEPGPATFTQKSGHGSPEVQGSTQSGWFPKPFEGLPISTGRSYSATAARRTVRVSTPIAFANSVSMFLPTLTRSWPGRSPSVTVACDRSKPLSSTRASARAVAPSGSSGRKTAPPSAAASAADWARVATR
ncbi:MAG: hypothetical protein M5U14_06275 [Acidimicrobiia bacterium]|nr:hypothetical protein [Acidimicrobiia bacterium]